MSRLETKYSTGPELEQIVEDYHLPLNAVKHGLEEQDEDRPIKKLIPSDLEEEVYETMDGVSDLEYLSLWNYLISWQFPQNATPSQKERIKNKAMSYEVIGDFLYKKANATFGKRRLLRQKEVLDILQANHDHLLTGHSGISRTFDKIKKEYYWPGYYDTVRRYVSSCEICQSFGPRNPPVPLSWNPKTLKEQLFSHVTIDYISLPSTKSGNIGALVLVDKFTGWVDCKPTPTLSSQFTCVSPFERIRQCGMMVQIHCNNGPHFNSEEVKNMMMNAYGIQLRFGVPYHPQGQGKIERYNGILKNILKKYSLQYYEQWDS